MFFKGYSRDKLIVLYILDALREDIALDTLCHFIADNGWTEYLVSKAAVGELEKLGMIAAVPKPFGQSYRITDYGSEMVASFENELRLSEREDIAAKIKANRQEFAALTRYFGDWTLRHDGLYDVSLNVAEGSKVLLAISVILPDVQSAAQAVKNWRTTATSIYAFMLDTLFAQAESTGVGKDSDGCR